jgi:uncharacterized protein (DUF1778 family)
MHKLSVRKNKAAAQSARRPGTKKNAPKARANATRSVRKVKMLPEKRFIPAKRERLEARIDADQKALIERAAQLQGRSVSDFVLATVQEAASRVVQEATVIELSATASRRFAAALLDPAPPNIAMQRAAARHRALVQA